MTFGRLLRAVAIGLCLCATAAWSGCAPLDRPAGDSAESRTGTDLTGDDVSDPDGAPPSGLPTAKYGATALYLTPVPASPSDRLTLATLQGHCANASGEQILLMTGAWEKYLSPIRDKGVRVTDRRENGEPWDLGSLLAVFSGVPEGYILCSDDLTDPSAFVAVSVAGVTGAVVVTSQNEKTAREAGLTLLLDARGKDDAWLRASAYFPQLSARVAVEQPVSMAPKLIDYAVMAGAYIRYYDGTSEREHREIFDFLDDGGCVLGYNNTLGEYATVGSLSQINLQLIPADHASNLSTLSGIGCDLPDISRPQNNDARRENVHTVTFIMSDGDNLQWMLNDFTSSKWFGSAERGRFPITWGLPCTAGQLCSPMVSYLYGNAGPTDGFIMALSGLGYTFPSRWNPRAREDMAQRVAACMAEMGLCYLEILDDNGFDADTLAAFTEQDAVRGAFYIDYADYAGKNGAVLWVNQKPCVSARYRLWAGVDGVSDPKGIAAALNASSTDVSSPAAYSVVIVHAWSGLDGQGRFVPGGDTMAAVRRLVSQLDPHVEVVGAGEFMERLTQNTAPAVP